MKLGGGVGPGTNPAMDTKGTKGRLCWKTSICHYMLKNFSVFKKVLGKIGCHTNRSDYLMLYNEICPYLGDMNNSVSQYFPNGKYPI